VGSAVVFQLEKYENFCPSELKIPKREATMLLFLVD